MIEIISMFVSAFFAAWLSSYISERRFKKRAIQNKAARYNPVTGEFEWNDEIKTDEV